MTVMRELQENPQGWDCAVATLYPSRHIANHFMDHILMELVNCIFGGSGNKVQWSFLLASDWCTQGTNGLPIIHSSFTLL